MALAFLSLNLTFLTLKKNQNQQSGVDRVKGYTTLCPFPHCENIDPFTKMREALDWKKHGYTEGERKSTEYDYSMHMCISSYKTFMVTSTKPHAL
jgi:hypothetical protein